jgi:hypothetical protein
LNDLEIVVSLVVALLCAAFAWGTKQFKSWVIAIGFDAGLVLDLPGIAFSVASYPWSDVLVLLVAVTAGLLMFHIAAHPPAP